MNELISLEILFFLFSIICYLILRFALLFQPQILGWFGEHWTKQELKKLSKDEYKIINDIFIEDNNSYHQIDHVVISKYGIFCIESKQYNGIIRGNKYDKYWVRTLGKKKIYYLNPIRQNYGHVKALSNNLNVDIDKVINIVCIPVRDTIKIEHDGEVVNFRELFDKIMSYKSILIDNPNEIYNELICKNIKDKSKRREHIKSIKSTNNKDLSTCPKCGGKLVKRTSQYGDFWGCSNYPKCKYKRNI